MYIVISLLIVISFLIVISLLIVLDLIPFNAIRMLLAKVHVM